MSSLCSCPNCFEYIAKTLKIPFSSHVYYTLSFITPLVRNCLREVMRLEKKFQLCRSCSCIWKVLLGYWEDIFEKKKKWSFSCSRWVQRVGVHAYVKHMLPLSKTRIALLKMGRSGAWGTTRGCWGFLWRGQFVLLSPPERAPSETLCPAVDLV